ncbi:hypothetical protein B0H19DRAFT_1057261 [Mycena capillaripes]|nr:hypothetical protein B0H19DRAFT_1057261 [Mycena capillaripes]
MCDLHIILLSLLPIARPVRLSTCVYRSREGLRGTAVSASGLRATYLAATPARVHARVKNMLSTPLLLPNEMQQVEHAGCACVSETGGPGTKMDTRVCWCKYRKGGRGAINAAEIHSFPLYTFALLLPTMYAIGPGHVAGRIAQYGYDIITADEGFSLSTMKLANPWLES